mmetsp:Transcript_3428/g.5777  ORF Transcript_3428/g.5777 Transcript_3428/m.5777 type:complete len:763 (+) Transcript_3428:282-2570(+)
MIWRLLFGDDAHQERRRSSHLAQALRMENSDLVHKLFVSMVLSEAVYKQKAEEVTSFVQLCNGLLPWTLAANRIRELQFSSDWASQRCVVTESGGSLFVCFRGTKAQRDFITDLNVFFDPVFDDYEADGEESEGSLEKKKAFSKLETPCAHRGFLFRAKAIPILWFYKVARARNLKLVFTGHSLGGAVAALATLRLLYWLNMKGKQWDHSNIACISFAAPAMGNLALQKYVASQNWDTLIYNYTLKEDFVPILMQPQRLLRWRSKRDLTKPAQPQLADENGNGHLNQNQAAANGKELKESSSSSSGTTISKTSKYFQVVKFAVRLRRMVPIVTLSRNGKGGDDLGSSSYVYIGRQLTVLQDAVVPASLKREVVKEYNELSEEVAEGPARDTESSRRWNLVKWAVESFEAHRMYTYRERIRACCGLGNKLPGPPQDVVLTSSVLPEIELHFGTVRLCKPLDPERTGDRASVHITVAGKGLMSCRNFHMGTSEGQLMKVTRYFSSKLDRLRASMWANMRFPEKFSFWEKAFSESEELFQLVLQVQLGQILHWDDIILKCRNDFHPETVCKLAVVPVHVRITGRHLAYAHSVHGLLREVNPQLLDDPYGIEYSVLSFAEHMIMNTIRRITIEEVSDTIVFVDAINHWLPGVPTIPYHLKRALEHGVESFAVILDDSDGPAEGQLELIHARTKEAGFSGGIVMNKEASRTLAGLRWWNTQMWLETLTGDKNLMEQIKRIHDALHITASTSMRASPILHKKSIQMNK